MGENRNKVFISYSHKNSDWLDKLEKLLLPLSRRELLALWSDKNIQIGDEWFYKIQVELASANVFVLFVSQDFLASDFIKKHELPRMLESAKAKSVKIIPVILDHCNIEHVKELADIKSFNPHSEPLEDLPPPLQKRELKRLCQEIYKALEPSNESTLNTLPKAPSEYGPSLLHLPYTNSHFFVGRNVFLERLHTQFCKDRSSQAINGMGGVGKTETAYQYAYRHQDDYKNIFWGKAHTRESLIQGFTTMAKTFELRFSSSNNQESIAVEFLRWIERQERWLLILDFVDDPDLAQCFIPRSGTGHVLLTTRRRSMGKMALPNMLDPFTPEEGALFLLKRLHEISSDDEFAAAQSHLKSRAIELSNLLGGLPLALDQAAAYIDQMSISIEEYIEIYSKARYKLLSEPASNDREEHQKSVAATFSLSFKKVEEENKAAADVLRLCAFLDPNEIPEEIFKDRIGDLGKTLNETTSDPLSLIKAIGDGARYSLLQRNPATKTNRLHRLVQAVIRDEMDTDQQRLWAERAIRAVNQAFPEVDYPTWPDCERLVQHATALSGVIKDLDFSFPESAQMLSRSGIYLKERGLYSQAESALRQALKIHEQCFGESHPNQSQILIQIADVRASIGDFAEAEQLYLRARSILEQSLGQNHPEAAILLNRIAILYDKQARIDDAEELYERCIEIYQKAGETESESYADTLCNLGLIRQSRNFSGQAMDFFRRALELKERLAGVDHPDAAIVRSILADSYREQEEYEIAIELLTHSLTILEKSFGPFHLRTAETIFTLADVYREKENYTTAESLYLRVLKIQIELLGANHRNVATTLNNLGLLYDSMNRAEEAERHYQKALKIYESWGATHHPDFGIFLYHLADRYHSAGRLAEAAFSYHRSLDVLEQVFGPDHPHVITVRENFELLKEEMKDQNNDQVA